MSCGCKTDAAKTSDSTDIVLKVDFLFLDDKVCVPCGSTAQTLSEAAGMLTEPLRSMGVDLVVEKIHVADLKAAEGQKFLSSPTIRVNGRDIDPARTEEDCPTCGDLAGGRTSVACRNWHWRDKVYQSAPVGRIVEAIMEAALPLNKSIEDCCREAEDDEDYVMPENLKRFFATQAPNQKMCC